MAHGQPGPEPTPEDIARGYEGGDVRMRGLIIFLIAFVASILVVNVVIYGVFQYLNVSTGAEEDNARAGHPLAMTLSPTPPAPQIEPSPGHEKMPHEDLADLRDIEARKLQAPASYQDRAAGVARFPLTMAMDMVEANGLPTKLPPLGPTTNPSVSYDSARPNTPLPPLDIR